MIIYIVFTLVNVIFQVSLNTFNYGCLAGWMSPILSLLKSEESPFGRPLTDYETSLMASLVCIGGLVGTIFFGFASDKYGRKVAVFGTTIPFLVIIQFIGSIHSFKNDTF